MIYSWVLLRHLLNQYVRISINFSSKEAIDFLEERSHYKNDSLDLRTHREKIL